MSQIEELKNLGVNVGDAMQRFMGNEKLFLKMIAKLPRSVREIDLKPDFDAGNSEQVTRDAHTIKGVMGNLSVEPLYKAYTEIVNLLRAGKPEEARSILTDILPLQEKILTYIEENIV